MCSFTNDTIHSLCRFITAASIFDTDAEKRRNVTVKRKNCKIHMCITLGFIM